MDFSFDIVASKCAAQMAQYQQCVLANQDGDWSNICKAQGRALTACADEKVPHLAKMKAACFNQINEYRACLDKNASASDEQVQEQCSPALKALWECTDAHKPKDI